MSTTSVMSRNMRDFLTLSEGRSRGKSAAAMRIPMNLARSIPAVIPEEPEKRTVQSRWNLIRDNIPRKLKRNNSIKRSRSAKTRNTRNTRKAPKLNRRLSNTSKRQYNGGKKKKSRKRHKKR